MEKHDSKTTFFDYAQALMDSDLSANARLVGMVIGKRYFIKETAFPGNARLSKDTGLKDERTIIKAKKELKEAGFLDYKKQGYNKTNAYFCIIPPVLASDASTGTDISCGSGTSTACGSNREEEKTSIKREEERLKTKTTAAVASAPAASLTISIKEGDELVKKIESLPQYIKPSLDYFNDEVSVDSSSLTDKGSSSTSLVDEGNAAQNAPVVVNRLDKVQEEAERRGITLTRDDVDLIRQYMRNRLYSGRGRVLTLTEAMDRIEANRVNAW